MDVNGYIGGNVVFKSVNGLCQFVFASENEHYYLESLVRVNLHQYLYIQLKKAGYSSVFFLIKGNTKDGYCELLIPEKEDADLYDSYSIKKSWFDKFWGVCEKNVTGKKVKIEDINQFADYMIQMMRENKGIAFVFTTETFDLLSSNGDFIRELAELSRRNDGHLVLNCISTEHTDSLIQLTREDGIFRSLLFEENMWIFTHYKNPYLYDLMQEHMVGKVHHLNELSYAGIRSMILHYLIGEIDLFNKYLSHIDDYSLIVYTWYCSRKFREHSIELLEQNLFPEIYKNGPVLLVDIEKNMNENRLVQMERLRVKLVEQNQKEEVRKVLFHYPNDTEFGIVEDNNNRSWIQLVDKMLLVESIEEETKKILYQIRGELKKTRAFPISKESKTDIESLNRDILEASEMGDYATFHKGVEALQFGICKWYAQTLENEEVNKESDTYKCLEMYFSIIDASQKLFHMRQLYEEDTKKIDDMKKEYMTLRQNVMTFMKENPQAEKLAEQVAAGILKETPATVKELLSRQNMAKNCYENGKLLSHERSNKHEKIEFLQNAIQQMEITLSGMKQECVVQQIRDLERTTSKVQELFVKDSELRKQIDEVSIKFEKTVEAAQDLVGEEIVPIQIDWKETDKNILEL